MSRRSLLFFPAIIIFFLSHFFLLPVYAKSSILLGNPSTSQITNSEEEVEVNVQLTMENSDGKTYYLRGVFYKSGSTNYCGYTWNGTSWFKGPYTGNNGWKNFLEVTISSQSASTTLLAKVDIDDSGCKEAGTYKFKVQRFTEGGSSTFDDQNEQDVFIHIPTPTTFSTPTPSPKSPSSTPKPPLSKTPIPLNSSPPFTGTGRPSPSSFISKNLLTDSSYSGTVIGEFLGLQTSSDSSTKDAESSSPSTLTRAVGLIILGLGIVFLAGALSFYIVRKKNQES
ncbi:hypothetical protein HYW55_03685 [Candidatus Gottesmanbacteria bacterium]|nr:hypothetical protein [Candidatus Gottesmanbacteria bacterium]